MVLEDRNLNVSVVSLGLVLALLPRFLGNFDFEFPSFSVIFFGVYGFSIAFGGLYRDIGRMGVFVDIAAVFGLALVFMGSPLGYPTGFDAWRWLLISFTFLLAIPASALVFLTGRKNSSSS